MPVDPLTKGLPCDVEAEKIILGSILLNPDTLESVEPIGVEAFHLEKHRRIFGRMKDLREANIPLDSITLVDSLQRAGQLESIDGMSYIISLTENLPEIVNLKAYIGIIQEKHRLRTIIFSAKASMDRALLGIDNASAIASALGDRMGEIGTESEDDLRTPGKVVDDYPGGPGAFLDPALHKQGLQTGFTRLDEMLGGGFRDGELIIIGARPGVGKSALMLNIASFMAMKRSLPAAIFSLEMTAESLVTRLTCSIARVDQQKFRAGYMNKDERERLQSALYDVTEAPLVISDRFGITAPQVARHIRRLSRQGRCAVACIDYLQLMGSEEKSETRNIDLGKITRRLKMLAGECAIPIILLSQLNRASEKRPGSKRPTLSDLRDSGCLSASTTKLFHSGGVQCATVSRMNTYSLNNSGSIAPRVSKNIPTGTRSMIRVKLRSGRFLDCTPDHKIMTDVGWIPAKDITADHSVAAARRIAEPKGTIRIPEAKWIGRMLGNGSMVGYSSPSFICSCSSVAEDFCRDTERLFGITPRPHPHSCEKVFQYDITAGPVRTRSGNPVKNWLKEQDLWGRRAPEKRVPDWFMEQADNASIAALLAGLYETDGTATPPHIKFSTTSNEMAWQVVWMLSRLGIFAYIDDGFLSDKSNHSCFSIAIANWSDVLSFRRQIPMIGRKRDVLFNKFGTRSKPGSNHGDRLGLWVGEEIARARREAGMSHAELGYRTQGKRISQADLMKVLKKLPQLTEKLGVLVNPNIYWDRLECITPIESGDVFDREVIGGPHNFVANGIIVHNSIEQDADTVIFIHREEIYKPDREDLKGVAELIVQKQRNGPQGTVSVRFLGQFTKFENMAYTDDVE